MTNLDLQDLANRILETAKTLAFELSIHNFSQNNSTQPEQSSSASDFSSIEPRANLEMANTSAVLSRKTKSYGVRMTQDTHDRINWAMNQMVGMRSMQQFIENAITEYLEKINGQLEASGVRYVDNSQDSKRM